MSEVLIVLILSAPIFLVVFLLNKSQKRRKRNEEEKLSNYLHPLLRQNGISPAFQKQLVYQYVVIDEKEKKLLVVHWKDFDFSHELHCLDDIKNLSVQTVRQHIAGDDQGKPEIFLAQVGIEMTLENTGEKRFLTFYSHIEHNISQVEGFTAEATQFCERLKKIKVVKPSTV